MPSKEADVLVGRRYLASGYVDQALDVLIDMPDGRRQAVSIADRHLVDCRGPRSFRARTGRVMIKAVK